MGDEDDLVSDSSEDDSIPLPAAWLMFRHFMGWQSEEEIGQKPDCIVYRDWHIFLYLMARGLVGSSL